MPSGKKLPQGDYWLWSLHFARQSAARYRAKPRAKRMAHNRYKRALRKLGAKERRRAARRKRDQETTIAAARAVKPASTPHVVRQRFHLTPEIIFASKSI